MVRVEPLCRMLSLCWASAGPIWGMLGPYVGLFRDYAGPMLGQFRGGNTNSTKLKDSEGAPVFTIQLTPKFHQIPPGTGIRPHSSGKEHLK